MGVDFVNLGLCFVILVFWVCFGVFGVAVRQKLVGVASFWIYSAMVFLRGL